MTVETINTEDATVSENKVSMEAIEKAVSERYGKKEETAPAEELVSDEEINDDSAPADDDSEEQDDKDPDDGVSEEDVDGEAAPVNDAEDDTELDSEVPEISDELLQEAVLSGMSIQDARDFGSDKLLKKVLGFVKKDKEDKDSKKEPEVSGKTTSDILDRIPDLSTDDYDEGFVNVVKTIKEVMKEALSERDAIIKELQGKSLETVASETKTWFDTKVASLGKEYSNILGGEDKSKITADSDFFKNRANVAKRMDVLENGYKAMGETPPSRDELFADAVKSLFGENVVKKQIKQKLSQRSSQHINRTNTQKLEENLSVKEQVIRDVERKMRELKK